MVMTDQQVAEAILKWWGAYYKETPAWKVEAMVRKWIFETTSWGPEMANDERVKLQNRVSTLIRSGNAQKGAQTRKKNRLKARAKTSQFALPLK